MSATAPPADGAMGVLVIVEPEPVAPLNALLASAEIPASNAVLLGKVHSRLAQDDDTGPVTAICLHSIGPGQSGTVSAGQGLTLPVLTVCCFYHRWMDTRHRKVVDAAITTGLGALMVVADTVLSAAQIGRYVRQRYDIPLQVHEVSTIWMSLGAMPVA